MPRRHITRVRPGPDATQEEWDSYLDYVGEFQKELDEERRGHGPSRDTDEDVGGDDDTDGGGEDE